jgi:hypothetical protein
MFHVKHLEVPDCWAYPQTLPGDRRSGSLFADAKIAEDDVENVLDIDASGQPAERLTGGAQLLGQQIFAAGKCERALQSGERILQSAAVALAGEQSRFGAGQHALGLGGEGGQQRLDACPGLSRNIESQIPVTGWVFISLS